MVKKRNDPEVKPIEKWTKEDWEKAYNVLMSRYNRLREHMRIALGHLNKAI